jgi:hypothetical protein
MVHRAQSAVKDRFRHPDLDVVTESTELGRGTTLDRLG